MATPNNLFIFEGPNGSGKSTLSRAFADYLQSIGIPCDWFASPGQEVGTLGHHVYTLHHSLRNVGIKAINPASLQMLHIAAHVDAIESRILPALKQGRYVVLDRFWWSTLVYGILTGVDRRSLEAMIHVERLHWRDIIPTRVFLLRRKAPLGESLTLEETSLAKEYRDLAAKEGRNYPVSAIDNDRTISEAFQEILEITKVITPSPLPAPCNVKLGRSSRIEIQRSSSPAVFTKLQPAKPTVVYDTYWRFAAERQAIFFRRLRGQAPPWTEDGILREFKFTNVYRASDRTSQYLIRNVIYAGDQTPEEVVFRILLFKVFNRIQTWELLTGALGQILYGDFAFDRYDEVLTKAINNGATIYSSAYIMPSAGSASSGGRKHRVHLKLVEQMLNDEIPSRLAEAPSMGKAFELLRAYPTIGDFLAYQYVTDLNYSAFLNFSEMEFVVPGPGARDGIRKCFSDLGGLTEADIIKVTTEQQEDEFHRLALEFHPLWRRRLQLIDCQNIFCEVDKYSRVAHPEISGLTGRTRIKRRYRVTGALPPCWYPPKWGLNQLIAKGFPHVPTV